MGLVIKLFKFSLRMQNIGTRPSVFTYTIMVSLVSSPCQGHQELALEQFHRMRSKELSPDEFTSSILISVCSNLQDLEQDWRIPYSFLENNINGTQLYAVP
ncbi:pentatricopeptide repeat-containing protein At1g43980, mitochondrial-like [Neltuma alba]|uniref:pentatricopeptide repeat-containing protein At1g43980, mitochondrial-like n=1 Tax=Neltuma alba TaxID=207710 RepID=UPI0010A409CE|nr:pentatricopeptide repeat-containing protein At1g43980, mitochondrial-like [Prosopis alba]